MRFGYKFLISIMLMITIFFQFSITSTAVNTVFDVPTISPDIQPDNMIYQSPNCNIIASKWSYGLDANIINTSNLDTLILELNSNVSTAGYSRSILGIYPDGANLSDSNADAIRNAGWTEVDLYYEKFLLAGSAPSAGMTPVVERIENTEILSLLGENYNYDNVAMVNVSGVCMSWANFSLYDENFSFLNNKTCYAYKYITDIEKFVYLQESYCGSYGRNILEIFSIENADDDVNGTYIVLAEELPAELVVTREEISTLRENLQNQVAIKPGKPDATDEMQGTNETPYKMETRIVKLENGIICIIVIKSQ